jgi:hypothetical protein
MDSIRQDGVVEVAEYSGTLYSEVGVDWMLEVQFVAMVKVGTDRDGRV